MNGKRNYKKNNKNYYQQIKILNSCKVRKVIYKTKYQNLNNKYRNLKIQLRNQNKV